MYAQSFSQKVFLVAINVKVNNQRDIGESSLVLSAQGQYIVWVWMVTSGVLFVRLFGPTFFPYINPSKLEIPLSPQPPPSLTGHESGGGSLHRPLFQGPLSFYSRYLGLPPPSLYGMSLFSNVGLEFGGCAAYVIQD